MDDFLSETGLKPEVASVLNGVFVACDAERTGLVFVSKFISFLKEKATGTEVCINSEIYLEGQQIMEEELFNCF